MLWLIGVTVQLQHVQLCSIIIAVCINTVSEAKKNYNSFLVQTQNAFSNQTKGRICQVISYHFRESEEKGI